MIARHSLAALLGAATLASAAMAESAYPLHLKNCGMDLTFEAAPVRVVTVGQAATEVLYALGLVKRWWAPRFGSQKCYRNSGS